MNTVILPIYNRPELFFYTIKRLKECRGFSNYNYIIMAEYGYKKENDCGFD